MELQQRAACIMITGAVRITPTKMLETFLDLQPLGIMMEVAALVGACHLPRPNMTNPETGPKIPFSSIQKQLQDTGRIHPYHFPPNPSGFPLHPRFSNNPSISDQFKLLLS